MRPPGGGVVGAVVVGGVPGAGVGRRGLQGGGGRAAVLSGAGSPPSVPLSDADDGRESRPAPSAAGRRAAGRPAGIAHGRCVLRRQIARRARTARRRIHGVRAVRPLLRPQGHRRWRRAGRDESFFELRWKPAGWDSRRRLVVVWRRPSAARGRASSTARAPRARLRVQGRGHQQARLRPRRGAVPRRPRCPAGDVRRTEVAVRPPATRRAEGGCLPRLRPRRACPQTSDANSRWHLPHPTRRTTAKRSSLWAFAQLPPPHRQLADLRPTVSQASSGASRSSAGPLRAPPRPAGATPPAGRH